MYHEDSPPKLEISHISLEDALSHIRIVYQRLHRINRDLKKTQKQLNSWYCKKCPKTTHIKAENIECLLLQQLHLRRMHRSFNGFHQQLQKKAKTRLKEVKATISHQIFVPHDLPPIPSYKRFSILDNTTENLSIKTWYDFLPKRSMADDTAVIPKPKKANQG